MTKETDAAHEKAVRVVYQRAASRLREAHRKEFDQYRHEEAEKMGITLIMRKSPEDKARDDLKKLLSANPSLEAELVAQIKGENVPDLP